ncbi:hypothetical protein SDJN03_03099, partial [Cucurbita argyrosperma subsp. sororia]
MWDRDFKAYHSVVFQFSYMAHSYKKQAIGTKSIEGKSTSQLLRHGRRIRGPPRAQVSKGRWTRIFLQKSNEKSPNTLASDELAHVGMSPRDDGHYLKDTLHAGNFTPLKVEKIN